MRSRLHQYGCRILNRVRSARLGGLAGGVVDSFGPGETAASPRAGGRHGADQTPWRRPSCRFSSRPWSELLSPDGGHESRTATDTLKGLRATLAKAQGVKMIAKLKEVAASLRTASSKMESRRQKGAGAIPAPSYPRRSSMPWAPFLAVRGIGTNSLSTIPISGRQLQLPLAACCSSRVMVPTGSWTAPFYPTSVIPCAACSCGRKAGDDYPGARPDYYAYFPCPTRPWTTASSSMPKSCRR